MGRVASSVDNGLMEFFWTTMQRELLDRRTWTPRTKLGSAISEWIEGLYNPTRRHSVLGYQSPADYETMHDRTHRRGLTTHPNGLAERVKLRRCPSPPPGAGHRLLWPRSARGQGGRPGDDVADGGGAAL